MKIILALLVAVIGSASLSQTAIVRGGDHRGFTRLVVSVEHQEAWELRQNGRQALLRLFDKGLEISTDQAFDRIQRNRVGSLQANGNELLIDLACNCFISASSIGSNLIVMDIAPGPMPVQPPLRDQVVPKETPERFGADISLSSYQMELLNNKPLSIPSREIFRSDPPSMLITSIDVDSPIFDGTLPELPKSLSELEKRLVEELGRAATQGILEPRTDKEQSGPEFEPKYASTHRNPSPEEDNSITFETTPMHFEVRGATENTLAYREINHPTLGISCESAPHFDVNSWGPFEEFPTALAALRSELYGEFDRPNPEAKLKLARLFVSFGMGAETILAANELENESSEKIPLKIIGNVLEFGYLHSGSELRRLTNCQNAVGLWAILADRDALILDEEIAKSAVIELRKLPQQLIELLAPKLSERLRASGHNPHAAVAVRSNNWTAEESSYENQLERVLLSIEENTETNPPEELLRLIETNSEQSPKALAEYIDMLVSKGEAVTADLTLLSETYARQYKNNEIGPLMQRASLLALASAGDFTSAFSKYQDIAENHDDDKKTLQLLLKLLVENADDATFLNYASVYTQLSQPVANTSTSLAMASRLGSLGFYKWASEIAAQKPSEILSNDEVTKRIELTLNAGDIPSATSLIGDLPEESQKFYLARMHELTGDYDTAFRLYSSLGDQESASRVIWKSEDITESATNDPVYEEYKDLLTRVSPPQDTNLVSARNLLSDTSDLLETILNVADEQDRLP